MWRLTGPGQIGLCCFLSARPRAMVDVSVTHRPAHSSTQPIQGRPATSWARRVSRICRELAGFAAKRMILKNDLRASAGGRAGRSIRPSFLQQMQHASLICALLRSEPETRQPSRRLIVLTAKSAACLGNYTFKSYHKRANHSAPSVSLVWPCCNAYIKLSRDASGDTCSQLFNKGTKMNIC